MKTLGLNMIVGAGDADVLKRCLESFDVNRWIDQVVICVTTNDEAVTRYVNSVADVMVQKSWTSDRYPFGDFAGARNAALEQCNTDYWIWLDADDVVQPKSDDCFRDIKKAINDYSFDVGLVQYALDSNDKGESSKTLLRERLIRRESGIRWKYPVHEQMTIDWKINSKANLKRFTIHHRPVKPVIAGVTRNFNIINHEYRHSVRNRNRHTLFYMARELSSMGKHEAAVPLFVSVLKDFTDGNSDKALIYESADALARFYIYNNIDQQNGTIKKETCAIGEWYARIAAAVSDVHAEPHVYIGDCYLERNDHEKAVARYNTAVSKTYGTAGLQDVDYYKFIPAMRLAGIYKENGDYETALLHNRDVLELEPTNKQAIRDRKELVCDLLKTIL